MILTGFVIFIILILLSFLRIGNQQVLEVKIDEVACAIGLNSSLPLGATITSGPIGKLFHFPANSIPSINHPDHLRKMNLNEEKKIMLLKGGLNSHPLWSGLAKFK